jgi:DNA-directed RNA polymerase alpha subunit
MSSDDKEIDKARKDLPAEHSVLREMSIEDLDISVRTYNCLVSAGVKNVEDLALMSDAEIAGLQGVTPTDLNKIKRLRFALGVSTETPRLEGSDLLDSLINHSSECSKAKELSSTEQPV